MPIPTGRYTISLVFRLGIVQVSLGFVARQGMICANLNGMTDANVFDEPPDDNEAFANLDESLDDEDILRPGEGPEGRRDLDTDLVVDEAELEEAGANLDDPEQISLLDGGIDDPDGSDPPEADDPDEGWDVEATDELAGDGDPEDADLLE